MSIFKKDQMIVTYNYDKYCKDDVDFLVNGLSEDLQKKYGICYNITLKPGETANVRIIKKKRHYREAQRRALQLKIRKHLRNTGSK